MSIFFFFTGLCARPMPFIFCWSPTSCLKILVSATLWSCFKTGFPPEVLRPVGWWDFTKIKQLLVEAVEICI